MVPVVELQYSDFLMLGMDGVVNQAAKLRYMTGGQAKIGMVIRLPYGHLRNYGAQHSQTLYGLFTNVPGLTVCVPATPADARGLLKTAIRASRPVLFFEHKKLYALKGDVPDDESTVAFGSARVYGNGGRATIVAIGWMLHEALKAQEELRKQGTDVTVVDPRTLVPLDLKTIVESVRKTAHLILVDEAPLRGGYTAAIAWEVHKAAFGYLAAAPGRVGVPDVPIPYSWPLEAAAIPDAAKIVEEVKHNLED
jgi:pyruvate/2-oxoglutarate/acetoin dehydrogenase E1 component